MKNKLITAICVAAALSACSTTYTISTDIARDGSAAREITTKGKPGPDSFLRDFDDTWRVSVGDSVTVIRKEARELEQLSAGFSFEEYNRPLAAPVESLEKHFRWFYTCYDFKAVWPEITDKGNIPLDSCFDERSAALWFRGDMSDFHGLNGVELKEELDRADEAFSKWLGRSFYEVYFQVISQFAQGGPYGSSLAAEKEKVLSDNQKTIQSLDFEFNDLCAMLDRHFKTDYFSGLYGENKTEMEAVIEERTKTIKLFETDIIYCLAMPGEVVSTDATISPDGRLEWKVDGWRILASDYTIRAQSRVPNYWAWAVTLIALAAACVVALISARSYLATLRR
jgi:hypothetical protein